MLFVIEPTLLIAEQGGAGRGGMLRALAITTDTRQTLDRHYDRLLKKNQHFGCVRFLKQICDSMDSFAAFAFL